MFFFTLSQQVSLEITKALFVSRGTVCASPLYLYSSHWNCSCPSTHWDDVFNRAVPLSAVSSATWAICAKLLYIRDTSHDHFTAQKTLPATLGSRSAGRTSTTRMLWPGRQAGSLVQRDRWWLVTPRCSCLPVNWASMSRSMRTYDSWSSICFSSMPLHGCGPLLHELARIKSIVASAV